jgi:mannose-6-phosphate isomerase-like protein (cupin superfamily)
MSTLTQHSVPKIAAGLERAFSVVNVAQVDDIVVGVYICQGKLGWHAHVDNDELFWVYEGEMLLETERGDVRLESDELAVVPKGTRHRSGSAGRATVLLLRCGFLANRKNGKRQLYAVGPPGLPSTNLWDQAELLPAPFRFRTLAQVEESVVQIARGRGRWPVEHPVAHDRMFYVVDGSLTLRTIRRTLSLEPGDFSVIPRGAFYHLHTAEDSLLVRVTREAL